MKRVQGVEGSRIQVKGMEVKPLESSNYFNLPQQTDLIVFTLQFYRSHAPAWERKCPFGSPRIMKIPPPPFAKVGF